MPLHQLVFSSRCWNRCAALAQQSRRKDFDFCNGCKSRLVVLNKQILVPSQLNWSTIIGPRLEAVWVSQLELQTASWWNWDLFSIFFFFPLFLCLIFPPSTLQTVRKEPRELLRPQTDGAFFFFLPFTCRHPFAPLGKKCLLGQKPTWLSNWTWLDIKHAPAAMVAWGED